MATKKATTKKKTATKSKAKKANKKTSTRINQKKKKQTILIYELKLVALVTLTVILAAALHTNAIGIFGVYAKKLLFGLFANAGYIIPYVTFVLVFVQINHNLEEVRVKYTLASVFLFVSVLLTLTTLSHDLVAESLKFNQIALFSSAGITESFKNGMTGQGGGVLGNWLTFAMVNIFGKIGTYIIALCLLAGAFILGTRMTVGEMIEKQKERQLARKEQRAINVQAMQAAKKVEQTQKSATKQVHVDDVAKAKPKANNFKEFDSSSYIEDTSHAKTKLSKKTADQLKDAVAESIAQKSAEPAMPEYVEPVMPEIKFNNFTMPEAHELDQKETDDQPLSKAEEKEIIKTMDESNQPAYENYIMPSIDMLTVNTSLTQSTSKDALLDKAKLLEQTLLNFGVEAKVVQVSQGPTITMYELQPSPGVKVSKIVGLSDDIALNLAAHHVRVAPIPGKAAVGIEVPNESTSMVMMRDVIDTKEFKSSKSKLSFALGKDISGKPIIGDLGKMPHMLIAGATGSGKSVCVNSIINSILFNATPDEVKLLMIDPKVVELSNYNGIPHLILPVVTDPKKAAIALNWGVQEMVRRYELFAENSVKDMKGYNNKADKINVERQAEADRRALEHPEEEKVTIEKMEKLPQIVVIIDELADLMMVAASAVEDAICRLAQMARAAGIHLIVATQRPSVDVITGVIKANIPSRIAFAVSSQTDSRTIIDMGGAEKLLGKGDMLYYPVGESKPKRIQGAFISEEETESVVEFVKTQATGTEYREEILETTSSSAGIGRDDDDDEYLKEAIELVVHAKSASVSMLQRKFRIGYNRAARMIDDMETRGIVGPSQGSKARNVLITPEAFEEQKQES